MEYINCTPHTINLNDGRSFEPSGDIARVSSSHTAIVDDVCSVRYGNVDGLPPIKKGVRVIVSAMVLGACSRSDLVAPATSHPECIRNEKGLLVSVPCFRI
jgi:hypothetical protein